MSIKKIIFWIVVLIALDQASKIIIYHYFFDVRFDIIPFLLEFHPKFNENHNSYFLSLFDLEVNVVFYIAYALIILVIATFLYLKQRKKYNIKILDYVFIFFAAGFICALLGYFLWKKGVLDFIHLKGLFIFDLKDVYLTVFGWCLFPIYMVKRDIIKKHRKIYGNI